MAATAWGPRYAPPDPTLPQPWTALIDGTTGLMYYWNLETNATQFEKPAAVLPFGPTVSQPVFSTPQQGSYTPHSYQGVSREQSQSYQFTPHYTRCQQWSQDYSRKRDYIIQKPPTRYGGAFLNTQQPSPFSQPQYGPTYQKQMATVSPVGLNMGFKDSSPFNAKNGGLALVPHQPQFPTPTPNMQQKMTANPVAIASPDAMSQSSDDIYPNNRDVTAAGDKVPAPFTTFESTGFPPEVLKEIYAAGFVSPTPVQAQTWPIAIQNRDVVTIAKTDSGKTLGYLIPAFMLLRRCNNNRLHGPTIVVISPTRELALQIQNQAIKFGRSVKISCSCLYGEAPKGPQLKDLDRGADILVATPGRLNDAFEMRKLDFGQVSLLVLDEADRMLDMGFEPQIRKIVNEIPPRRQTLMYTATWPEEVRKIAGDLLVNPVQVNVDNADEVAANKSVTQDCKRTPDHVKAKGATQRVPHKEGETVTRRGGRRDDRFGGRNRNDRPEDLYGRERFDNRRDGGRRRGRSYSRSRSRSRSWSRSRTRLRRERSRSWSRGHNISPRRVRRKRQSRSRSRSLSWSWSRGHSHRQSRSRSPGRSWSRGSSRSRSRTPAWRESK